LNELIQNLKSISDLNLEEGDSSWEIKIPFARESYFELTIPKDVNEWFVSFFSSETNDKIWSDWVDWYISGEINKENVRICFQRDIEYFIERVLAATDYRIVNNPGFKFFGKEFFKTSDLELFINKEWILVEPGELPEDFEIP
jgi:hypothetical protein|tara:strand:- start:494 stop:922 length:429 start_codon:yes stop_codon:yes gene_type:complete